MFKLFFKKFIVFFVLVITIITKSFAEDTPTDKRCEIPSANGLTAVCGTLISNLFEKETINNKGVFTKANYVRGATVAIYTEIKNGYYIKPFSSTATNGEGFFRIEINQSVKNNEAYLLVFCGDKRVSATKFNVKDPSGNTSNKFFELPKMMVPCSKINTYTYTEPPEKEQIIVKDNDFLKCTAGSMLETKEDFVEKATPVDNSKFTTYSQSFQAGEKQTFDITPLEFLFLKGLKEAGIPLDKIYTEIRAWLINKKNIEDYFSVAGDNKAIYADPVKTGSWNCFAGGCAAEGLGLLEDTTYESSKEANETSKPDLAPCENYKLAKRTKPDGESPLNKQYGGFLVALTMPTAWTSECATADLNKPVCKDSSGNDVTLGEIQPPSLYSRDGWSNSGSYKYDQAYFSPIMCTTTGPAVTKTTSKFTNASIESNDPMEYTYASAENREDFNNPAKNESYKVGFPGADGVSASPVLGSNLAGGGEVEKDMSNILSLPKFNNKTSNTILASNVKKGRELVSLDNPIAGCSISSTNTEKKLSGFFDKYYVNNEFDRNTEPEKLGSVDAEANKIKYEIGNLTGIQPATTNIYVAKGGEGDDPNIEDLKVFKKTPEGNSVFKGFVDFFRSGAALIKELIDNEDADGCVKTGTRICDEDPVTKEKKNCREGPPYEYTCTVDKSVTATIETKVEPENIYDQAKIAQAGDKLMMNLLMPNKQVSVRAGALTESDMTKRLDISEEARKMAELKGVPISTGNRDIYTVLSSMPLQKTNQTPTTLYFHCLGDDAEGILSGNTQQKQIKQIGNCNYSPTDPSDDDNSTIGDCGICLNDSSGINSAVSAMKPVLEEAAAEFNMPAALLVGVLYAEGAFESNRPWDWTEENVQEWSTNGNMPGCSDSIETAQGPYQFLKPYFNSVKPSANASRCNFLDASKAAAKMLSENTSVSCGNAWDKDITDFFGETMALARSKILHYYCGYSQEYCISGVASNYANMGYEIYQKFKCY